MQLKKVTEQLKDEDDESKRAALEKAKAKFAADIKALEAAKTAESGDSAADAQPSTDADADAGAPKEEDPAATAPEPVTATFGKFKEQWATLGFKKEEIEDFIRGLQAIKWVELQDKLKARGNCRLMYVWRRSRASHFLLPWDHFSFTRVICCIFFFLAIASTAARTPCSSTSKRSGARRLKFKRPCYQSCFKTARTFIPFLSLPLHCYPCACVVLRHHNRMGWAIGITFIVGNIFDAVRLEYSRRNFPDNAPPHTGFKTLCFNSALAPEKRWLLSSTRSHGATRPGVMCKLALSRRRFCSIVKPQESSKNWLKALASRWRLRSTATTQPIR